MADVEVPPEDLPDNTSGTEVPPEDIPSGHDVPTSDLPDTNQDQYSSAGQQALTAIEGLGRGATAGLSDALAGGMRNVATKLGVSPENLHYVAPEPQQIAGRKAANPIEAGASELAGNIGLMNRLPQIGSKAINGMIQMGIISGGDELSKALLGQGDPLSAVASHIAEAGAGGLLLGGIFGKLEKSGIKSGLQAIENQKLGKTIKGFISGMGHAATLPGEEVVPLTESAFTPEEISNMSNTAFQVGQKAYKNIGAIGPTTIGYHIAGVSGATTGLVAEKFLEKVLSPYISKASQKYAAPAILKAASSGVVDNLTQVLDHASSCSQGAQKIANGVENLFKAGGNKIVNPPKMDKYRDDLKDFVDEGGTDQAVREEAQKQPQGFAKGGEVKTEEPDAISKVYPEQHILLSAAKARVSNYLNSVKPVKNTNQMTYDNEHKDPRDEKEYNKTIDLANNPLSILNHVKDGSLVPKQIKDFSSMYPELHEHLSKKIGERIVKGKFDEEKKPPYHVRQAMSLFMGTNLDRNLSQPNIMAAQNVFAMQQAQRQMPKTKGDSLEKIGQSSQTPDQSRQQRLRKS